MFQRFAARLALTISRLVRIGLLATVLISAVAALLAPAVRRGAVGPLDLAQPVGPFTGRKLAMLADDPAKCRALLAKAGIDFSPVSPHDGPPQCRFDDAVRLRSGGSLPIDLRPVGPPLACPLAAGLAMWAWNVVQPAALDLYGSRVVAIDHYGSYNCRRIYGRATGDWSEHARADAIDVAGFGLADGRRITVAADWTGGGRDAAFLHRVRDGACDVFATVLSPDYNAAHRDHLHLDQARRGGWGWRACR